MLDEKVVKQYLFFLLCFKTIKGGAMFSHWRKTYPLSNCEHWNLEYCAVHIKHIKSAMQYIFYTFLYISLEVQ